MKKKTVNNEDYVALRKCAKIQHIIDSVSGNNVLLYGAGKHTDYILSTCYLKEKNIKICDSNKNGQSKNNYNICELNAKLIAWADAIVICLFYERKTVYDCLLKLGVDKHKIFLLYDEQDTEPIYIYNIETNAERISWICNEAEYGRQNRYTPWKVQGMGEKYEKSVEKNFFEAVTKELYLQWIKKGDNVLDVGAGTGRLSIEMEKIGAIVTAIDTSKDMLNVLRKKNSTINIKVVKDGSSVPFENNTFDKVVSCDAMIHFLNWKDFLTEHKRVVKTNGYIIYNMFNDDHLKFISNDKRIRTSYISDCGGYGSAVSRKELEKICDELGGLELVAMIPYGFLAQTAYSYGILTHSEMISLQKWYMDLFSNSVMRRILGEFEKEIVSKENEIITSQNIIVFRKIGDSDENNSI